MRPVHQRNRAMKDAVEGDDPKLAEALLVPFAEMHGTESAQYKAYVLVMDAGPALLTFPYVVALDLVQRALSQESMDELTLLEATRVYASMIPELRRIGGQLKPTDDIPSMIRVVVDHRGVTAEERADNRGPGLEVK